VATVAARSPPAHPRETAPPPQALVTDKTQNELLVVDLRTGRVVRRVALPPDPEDIAARAAGGDVVVVRAAGKVTVLDRDSLRPIRILAGLHSPHIPAISPDGRYAYVTDYARGTVTAIDLANMRVTSTIEVGAGAHHMSFSPDQSRVWVALGESARTIVTLDTSDVAHPRVTGLDPGFAVHDLSFSPDGQRVWVTAATESDASRTRRAAGLVRPARETAAGGRCAWSIWPPATREVAISAP